MKGSDNLRDFVAAYYPQDEQSAAKGKFSKKYPGVLTEIEVFGENQNSFNQKAADCFNELNDRLMRLEDALAAEIQARKKAESFRLVFKKGT